MYDELIKDKIGDSLKTNQYVNNFVKKRFQSQDDKLFKIIKNEIDLFLMDNDELYKFSNFNDLMYKSFLEMDDNRFANFIRNVVTDSPDKDRTYKHLLNDFQDKLHEQYKLPNSYYHMSKSELDNTCDDLLLTENYFMISKVRKFMIDNFKVSDFNYYVKENRDLAIKILKSKDADETNKSYLRIRKMLEHHSGYIGLFTYFHFIEKISFVRIKIMFRMLMEHKAILRMLPMSPFDYMNQKLPFTGPDGRQYTTNFERLEDDLIRIVDIHKAKLFANDYPSLLRHNLHKNSDYVEVIRELTVDSPEAKKKLEMYYEFFLKKVSRYKTQQELIDALIKFVYSSSENENIEKIINSDFNIKLVYNDGELIIVRVLAFESMNPIASDTSWCIKDSLSYWTSYVDSSTVQLILINFSQPSTSIHRKIGITLNNNSYHGGYSFRTAHLKNDNFISEDALNKILKDYDLSLKDLFEISKDMGSNETYTSSDYDDDDNRRYNG